MNERKMRTVTVNDRGQIVIPEDVRKDLQIKNNSILILIETDGEIILKREQEVITHLNNEETFWKSMSEESFKNSWDDSDDVWEKYYEDEKKWNRKK